MILNHLLGNENYLTAFRIEEGTFQFTRTFTFVLFFSSFLKQRHQCYNINVFSYKDRIIIFCTTFSLKTYLKTAVHSSGAKVTSLLFQLPLYFLLTINLLVIH